MAPGTTDEARVAWRSYHDWVLPRRAVLAILTGSLLFLFLGLLLLAIGGGLGVGGLIATGAVLAGIGGCGMLVCLLLCLHAYFIFNVKDEAIQTTDNPWSDEITPQEIPGYAVINKPSALKSADSTLRRNGGGIKKVTMAPDVALDADRAPALRTSGSSDAGQAQIGRFSPTPATPSTPGYRTIGNYAVIDTGSMHQQSSPMESYDQRSFAQQQQFQTLHQQQLQQQQLQQQQRQQAQSFQSMQRQRDDLDIQQQRQQLEMHRQHLLQQQQHQQQPQQFRIQPQGGQSVTYAQIQRVPIQVQHSPSPSVGSQQSSSIVSNYGSSLTGGGTGVSGGVGGGVSATSSLGKESSSSFTYHKIQTQGLQYQSGRPYYVDDDYDNPAEGTPMLAQTTSQSRVVGGSSSGGRITTNADVPEPAPLVYPSARRPMTFEQQSSSKMSIYDNVLFPYAEKDDE